MAQQFSSNNERTQVEMQFADGTIEVKILFTSIGIFNGH